MSAIGVILQEYLILPRADNEKLHIIESQSLWYIHGTSANFSLLFQSDTEYLKVREESKNEIVEAKMKL